MQSPKKPLTPGPRSRSSAGLLRSRRPIGVSTINVITAGSMEAAVREAVQHADALVMAAAVADYAPAEVSEQKIKKAGETMSIALKRNPDILGNLAGVELPGLVRIGFAAETQDLLENARQKLDKKRLDMIIANDAVSSIGSEESALTLIMRDGSIEQLPPMLKQQSARVIVERLAALLDGR